MRCAICILATLTALSSSGCRSAVVVGPNDPDTQMIVTVEHRPATQPGDKGLVIQEKR